MITDETNHILGLLRRFDAQRWRAADAEAIARADAELREVLRAEPGNAGAAHELALCEWLAGKRRTAIVRLRAVARLDPDRAGEVAEQIAAIEAAESRLSTAKAEQQDRVAAERAEQRAAARIRAQEKALLQGEREVREHGIDIDQARKLWKPATAIVVALAWWLLKDAAGCAVDEHERQSSRPAVEAVTPGDSHR
ncbi:hypothetical protein [Nocardia sp. NPDC057668]|uniref:hypothetical protein n=1 Tax=Nocardia sp. NPDC057668 TaxID=3346202 RepID=UPI00367237D4